MIGRVLIALLLIAAAAVVTMERETAVVADMSADIAESKYSDAEERAKRYEDRAKAAEAKATELEIKNQWLEAENAKAVHERELALLPLEVKLTQPSMKGALDQRELMRVAQLHAEDAKACFARAPTRGPQVAVRWVVQPNGRVASVSADVPGGYDDVVDCLRVEIGTWVFAPSNAGLSLAQLTWDTTPPVAR